MDASDASVMSQPQRCLPQRKTNERMDRRRRIGGTSRGNVPGERPGETSRVNVAVTSPACGPPSPRQQHHPHTMRHIVFRDTEFTDLLRGRLPPCRHSGHRAPCDQLEAAPSGLVLCLDVSAVFTCCVLCRTCSVLTDVPAWCQHDQTPSLESRLRPDELPVSYGA